MKRKRYLREGKLRFTLSVQNTKYVKELARRAGKPWKWYLGHVVLREGLKLVEARRSGINSCRGCE